MAEDSTPPIPPQTEAPRYAPQVVQPQKLKRATWETRQVRSGEPPAMHRRRPQNRRRRGTGSVATAIGYGLKPPAMNLRAVPSFIAAIGLLSINVSALEVTGLRCEYLAEPRGMDVGQPRLSWQIRSERRGERQTAYQVLVASSEGGLRHNRGDLWDTGQVASDQSIQVTYGGQALTSWMRCYWKVRAWNRNGKVSSWSAPADWQDARRYRPGRW